MPNLTAIDHGFAQLHYGFQGLADGKVSALKNDEGEVIFRPKGNSIPSKIHHFLVGRNLARRKIDRILQGVAAKTGNQATHQAIAGARRAARQGRIADLKGHLEVVATALTKDFEVPSAAGLGELPDVDAVKALRPALAKAAAGDISEAVALLQKSFHSSPLFSADKDVHLPALHAFETGGKAELAASLLVACPSLSPEAADDIVMEAFQAAIRTSTNFAVASGADVDDKGRCTNIHTFTMPDGTEFVRPKSDEAKGGSFGKVGFFTATDGRKLVLKWIDPQDSSKTTGAAIGEIVNEAHMQDLAWKAAPGHVMEPVALVRMPDGRFALAMEIGELGDLYQLQPDLASEDTSVKNFVATRILETAVALGEAGLAHGDFKEPNMFITKDGDIKAADFGEARKGRRLAVATSGATIHNETWLDPASRETTYGVARAIKAIDARFQKEVKDRGVVKGSAARQELDERWTAAIDKAKGYAVIDGQRADWWNTGVMVWRTLVGESRFSHAFRSTIDDQLAHYAGLKTEEERRAYLFPPGSPITDPLQQDMLAGLLDPNPLTRISPAEVIASGAFAVPEGVDLTGLRARIRDLALARRT